MQLNQSIVIPATSVSPFDGPSSNSRAINSLFYTSLGLSLANVTIGLLCLQWIRSLGAQCPGIEAKTFLLFRHRRSHAFEAWGAKGMILALPLLLLMSLLSFFIALLISVSSGDWAVASPLYAILIALLAIILVTTFAPAIVNLWHGAMSHWPGDAPFPPFHSLQSWIMFQGLNNCILLFHHIVGWPVSNGYRAYHSLPDWVQVDQFWAFTLASQLQRRASILFPLTLSFSKAADSELLYHCCSDAFPENEVVGGCGRRLGIYRRIVENAKGINATALLRVQDQLVRCFVGLINCGTPLANLGSLIVENNMDFDFVSSGIVIRLHLSLNTSFSCPPSDVLLQLVNALLRAFDRESQSILDEGQWELLWTAMAACVQHADRSGYDSPWTMPTLLRDCLDLVERHIEHPATDTAIIDGIGYRYFFNVLLDCLDLVPHYRRDQVGRKVITTVIRHGAWKRMQEITRFDLRAEFKRIQELTAPFADSVADDKELGEVKHCVYPII